MSYLRMLYGSRLPQPRYPRTDEQASEYWHLDTESSKEMALAMAECEEDNGKEKKREIPKALLPTIERSQVSTTVNLPSLFGVPTLHQNINFSDLNLSQSPTNASKNPLSPEWLISIAAADIDNAPHSLDTSISNFDHLSRALDKDYIQALRQNRLQDLQSTEIDRDVPTETKTKRRFLCLLRRINELRSQQIPLDPENRVDGLPYAQLITLPTFHYIPRILNAEDMELRVKICGNQSKIREVTHSHSYTTRCAICFDDYEAEEELRALPCLHFYHMKCIDKWLIASRQCPICMYIVAVY